METADSPADDAEVVAELTQCQPALLLYVRSLMPGDPAAEEVVQRTNAKIWQKRSDYQSGTHFQAWAMAVARYEILNYRKQQARDARLHFSDELEQLVAVEAVSIADDLAERKRALQQCLAEMKAENRELLMSRYRSIEPLADVAARVGRSVGGLRVTLTRLRSALVECISRRIASESAGRMRPGGGAT